MPPFQDMLPKDSKVLPWIPDLLLLKAQPRRRSGRDFRGEAGLRFQPLSCLAPETPGSRD